MKTQLLTISGLTTRVVERTPDPKQTVVLLHGFGAPGDDLVALAQYIDAPARFVFPEAPLELGGLYGDSRAWWLLDLAELEAQLRTGAVRDRRSEVPPGLADARTLAMRFIDDVQAQFSISNTELVLGGFSQGAMLALDVALHLEATPSALVLMSGTLLAESVWKPRMSKLETVPVFQSHGQHDALLPFSIAELMRDQLRGAGAAIEWFEFHGGHEIPPAALDDLGRFLRAIGSMSR